MARRSVEPPPDPLQSARLLPTDAERELIGWLLFKPERAKEVLGTVTPQHFHSALCRETLRAAALLLERGQVPTLDALVPLLEAKKVTKLDLIALYGGRFVGTHWEQYARQIREAAALRRLYYAAQGVVDQITDSDVGDLREALYAALLDDADLPVAEDAASAHVDEMVSAERVVPSGLTAVDDLMGGVQTPSLVVLGARTSVGKTAMAVHLAKEWAQSDRRVSFLSLEMSRGQILRRLAAAVSGWGIGSLSDHDLEVRDAVNGVVSRVAVHDRARRLDAIRSRAYQHATLLGGLDAVIIDYVQLIDAGQRREENRYQAIGRVSRALKALAMDLGCVVFLLAQLSREIERRNGAGAEPQVSDLRESGDLEQDADYVWLLWRDKRDKVSPLSGTRRVKVKIGKNRFGPTGHVEVLFDPSSMRFVEL